MLALDEANRLLILECTTTCDSPTRGKGAALLGGRQRSVGHQAADAGDILGGLALPRDPVHDAPAPGHRVLKGTKS